MVVGIVNEICVSSMENDPGIIPFFEYFNRNDEACRRFREETRDYLDFERKSPSSGTGSMLRFLVVTFYLPASFFPSDDVQFFLSLERA